MLLTRLSQPAPPPAPTPAPHLLQSVAGQLAARAKDRTMVLGCELLQLGAELLLLLRDHSECAHLGRKESCRRKDSSASPPPSPSPSSQNHWPMDLLRSCTVPLAKIFAKPPPSDGSGPQRDCQGVGRKGTREEDPRLLTPSDILPLDDTEEKERTRLLCPGLSRWPVPSSQGSQDCSDVGETFCVWPRTSSTRVLPNS